MRLPAFEEFLQPAPLFAVVVMAVNDAWAKPAFHNALTGKLSDFAICFFLPLYLSALLEVVVPWEKRTRVFAGALLATAVFVAINVSHEAAALFCEALRVVGSPLGMRHFRVTVDPTDLVALAFTLLAIHHGLGRFSHPLPAKGAAS